VIAAFEREGSVRTPEECEAVWRDQLPFFLARPAPGLLDDVAWRPDVHEDYGDLELRARLGEVQVRLLAIGGQLDLSIPPAATEEIARLAPRGASSILPGSAHFPYAEDPDAYSEVLADWLATS